MIFLLPMYYFNDNFKNKSAFEREGREEIITGIVGLGLVSATEAFSFEGAVGHLELFDGRIVEFKPAAL